MAEGKMQTSRDSEVIDEEFAVGIGEVCGGNGERRSEGFQQGLEDRIRLPALGDGLVEIAEDAEREVRSDFATTVAKAMVVKEATTDRSEVSIEDRSEEMEVGEMFFP